MIELTGSPSKIDYHAYNEPCLSGAITMAILSLNWSQTVKSSLKTRRLNLSLCLYKSNTLFAILTTPIQLLDQAVSKLYVPGTKPESLHDNLYFLVHISELPSNYYQTLLVSWIFVLCLFSWFSTIQTLTTKLTCTVKSS